MITLLADTFLGIEHGTFLHIMLAVAVTLLVLDIFICTELLSWLSLLIFAAWGTWLVGAPWQWSVLVFIGFLALVCALYYTLWVQCVRRVIMGVLLRNAPRESTEDIVGKTAVVLGEAESLCIRWEDHIIPIEPDSRSGLTAGDKVVILAIRGGLAHVRKA
ncbi:MAG: hypothetical protein IJB00_07880 [Akkermansia sp.]|nr:hypothetical protein [Akkermansia sp.]